LRFPFCNTNFDAEEIASLGKS